MNMLKIYNDFINKHPDFAKDIVSYEEGEHYSLIFKMRDGKTAYYYPLVEKDGLKHSKRKK